MPLLCFVEVAGAERPEFIQVGWKTSILGGQIAQQLPLISHKNQ
jgi:hypothetical protein